MRYMCIMSIVSTLLRGREVFKVRQRLLCSSPNWALRGNPTTNPITVCLTLYDVRTTVGVPCTSMRSISSMPSRAIQMVLPGTSIASHMVNAIGFETWRVLQCAIYWWISAHEYRNWTKKAWARVDEHCISRMFSSSSDTILVPKYKYEVAMSIKMVIFSPLEFVRSHFFGTESFHINSIDVVNILRNMSGHSTILWVHGCCWSCGLCQ